MFNLKEIMLRAWRLYRANEELSFPEALHRSWLSAKAEPINADRIAEAKAAAGVAEEARTYGCGCIQITASDMGVLLYTAFGFRKNGNFMQYNL